VYDAATHIVTVQAGPLAGMKKHGPFTDSDAAFAEAAYEPEIVAALTEHCPPGGIALDIGANVGYHTLLLSVLVGPGGAVHAFEPVPSTAESLEQTLVVNDLSNVVVHRVALGSSTGTTQMRVGRESESGRAHVIDGTVGYRSELSGETRIIDVPVASVDELLASRAIPEPGLVKIDVEGAELLALTGMRQTLSSVRPVVVAEFWGEHNSAEAGRLLSSLGYTVTVLSEWHGLVDGSEVVVRNVLARPDGVS
jgi:FkbM family methyltransferase